MKEVKRKIKIPLYGGHIIVVISDEDDVYESSKRHFDIDDLSCKDNDAVVLYTKSSDLYPVLFSKSISVGIIAHEAKHIVNRIFKDIGIELDRNNDEAECYLLMWIVNRIWEVKTKFEKQP